MKGPSNYFKTIVILTRVWWKVSKVVASSSMQGLRVPPEVSQNQRAAGAKATGYSLWM